MKELEYLGFVGDVFGMDDDGMLYVEASDMADQVVVACGKNLGELEKNFKIEVEGLLNNTK